ncbi:DUF2076 domain-containing protein [Methylopila sp. M107]|uniref:DUF2076 domain-containing protein n=1 Tax=Methylopila sp. M107 TaxID=1101190 RepID=UPI00036F429A|nr:DUF2076 domain-containing protein [Methylopila sp. M107]
MNDAERDLISGLFSRIRAVETARRDPEAEAYIADQVSAQPHAPYAMAQTLVVQDQSLKAAQARIEELERELAAAREDAERPGSFSDGLGQRPSVAAPSPSPWGPRAQETMARAEATRPGGAWGRPDEPLSPPFGAPRPGYGQQDGYGGQPGYGAPQPRYEEPSRGGGFLSGALQTAAGVAAGALIFQGAKSIFGGGEEKAQGAGGEAARAEGGGQAAEAGDAGGGSTNEIGDWFGGLFGGATGDSAADDRADGDGDGDWT